MKIKFVLLFLLMTNQLVAQEQKKTIDDLSKKSIGYQLNAGVKVVGNFVNISKVLSNNDYSKSNPFFAIYGLGINYALGSKWEIGINAQMSNSFGNMKSNTTLLASDVRLGYIAFQTEIISITPFLSFGPVLAQMNSRNNDRNIQNFDSLLVHNNAIQITNGWFVPTIGLDLLKPSQKYHNTNFGISIGYQFSIKKQSWGLDDRNIVNAPEDAFHSFFLCLKIKNWSI